MKNQLKEIKEKVAKLQYSLIGIEEEEYYDDSDSLLWNYTQKYDKFISEELDFYYKIA